MKKLLILLFSLFFLSSPSVFADDISDFQIEGISIGDSLLDYMTEDEILKEIEANRNLYYYLNEPNKYVEVYVLKDFPTYDMVSVFVKNNSLNLYVTNSNEKYTILSIRGMMPYIQDFDNCLKNRDEISEVLSGMFPNSYKSEIRSVHPADPSGNSIIDHVTFNFESGEVANIHCSNWDENYRIKNNYKEGLNIQLYSKELSAWMRDRDY